jgi:hypothetical protein
MRLFALTSLFLATPLAAAVCAEPNPALFAQDPGAVETHQEGKANAEKQKAEKEARDKTKQGEKAADKAAKEQQELDKELEKQADKAARDKDKQVHAVANKMLADAKKHEERVARITRLQAVFAEKGDESKVAELDAMLQKENDLYTAQMAAYEQQLGPEMFQKIHGPLAAMEGLRGKERAEARKQLRETLDKGKTKEHGKERAEDARKGKDADAGKGKGKGKGKGGSER